MTVPRSPQVNLASGILQIRLANDLGDLESAQRSLREFLEAAHVDERATYQMELAFEELVVNAIRHAYADREPASCWINVSVCVRDEELVLTVEDEGPPFDPLKLPDPETPATIADAKIGGLGLQLVRKAAKRFEYERTANRNRVTVGLQRVKRIGTGQ